MSDKVSRSEVTFEDYTVDMEDPASSLMGLEDEDYLDEEYLYEDELIDPKEKRTKDGKTVVVPAKEKRLGGKKAYKEYMDSMKNQKRNLPMNPDNLPLKHKIKKIFKNDHRYYGKYVHRVRT
jgi:hypothetical protein